ncbi:MAG: chemotaxis protein CheD [Brevinematales bacterium]|nr:chemotaxis protein CheD [Brevinematales bacterium]
METQYLKSGESIISDSDVRVFTILGSCVAIMLYDPKLKLGAMSHALLPDSSYSTTERREQNPMLYVDQGFHKLLDKMLDRGSLKRRLIVKIFGGSGINICKDELCVNPRVGEKNAQKALEIIEKEGLNLAVNDTGGDTGRKLIFYPAQGVVYRKFVMKNPYE